MWSPSTYQDSSDLLLTVKYLKEQKMHDQESAPELVPKSSLVQEFDPESSLVQDF